MQVPLLKQGPYLIASIQSALSDADLLKHRDAIVEQVGKVRSKGVIVDVTALDVMDSFATRTLRDIAHMIRLRGAQTVIVGVQPEVAFALVQLGLSLEGGRDGARPGRRLGVPPADGQAKPNRGQATWALSGPQQTPPGR